MLVVVSAHRLGRSVVRLPSDMTEDDGHQERHPGCPERRQPIVPENPSGGGSVARLILKRNAKIGEVSGSDC